MCHSVPRCGWISLAEYATSTSYLIIVSKAICTIHNNEMLHVGSILISLSFLVRTDSKRYCLIALSLYQGTKNMYNTCIAIQVYEFESVFLLSAQVESGWMS